MTCSSSSCARIHILSCSLTHAVALAFWHIPSHMPSQTCALVISTSCTDADIGSAMRSPGGVYRDDKRFTRLQRPGGLQQTTWVQGMSHMFFLDRSTGQSTLARYVTAKHALCVSDCSIMLVMMVIPSMMPMVMWRMMILVTSKDTSSK